MLQLTLEQLEATAKSSLLDALWKLLPNGCQQLGRTAHGKGTVWWCEDDEGDCTNECMLSDTTIATLWAHALSDAAQEHAIGCGPGSWGGERMRPQMADLHSSGRVDAVVRAETFGNDIARLERRLGDRRGEPLLPPADGCSVADIMETKNSFNDGGALLEPVLANASKFESVLKRSPDLQQRLCALYYSDFVCAGYALPDACTDTPDVWLEGAMADLLSNAPIVIKHDE